MMAMFKDLLPGMLRVGLIALFPMLEGTDEVSKVGVLDLSGKCRFSMSAKMATSVSY